MTLRKFVMSNSLTKDPSMLKKLELPEMDIFVLTHIFYVLTLVKKSQAARNRGSQ